MINLLQRLYLFIIFIWSLLNFFFEVDSIKFFEKKIGLISSKWLSFIFILILSFEVVLFLSNDGDEVIEVLVKIDSLCIIESEFLGEGLQLFWVSSCSDVNREVFYGSPEVLAMDLTQQLNELFSILCPLLLLMRKHSLKLVNDEIIGA